jgi:hypothetical protein
LNKHILHKDVQDFIDQNLKSNLTQLILKGAPFQEVTIQEIATQIVAKEKSKKKLPIWFQAQNIYYPPKLNLEQTSSEITADYKATIVSGKRIVDATGGFGVDSYAFSKYFEEVVHCELNAELSNIAAHNFTQLKAENIHVHLGNGIEYSKNSNEAFDCIYIDPSRRNEAKGKVFLLEDCEPNVPRELDELFLKSNTILIKASPMLDITSAVGELHSVEEIHIVAVLGEVKELLFLLRKGYSGNIRLKTINFQKENHQLFEFLFRSEANATFSLPKKYLYEPNAAIMKSGGFHHVSNLLQLDKLHQHSHLYTSEEPLNFPGRTFEIIEVIKYDKKKIKSLLKENKANITARNFPKTVQQLRKELKLKDGGLDYLFFTTNLNDEKICIRTRKVSCINMCK